MTKLLEQRAIFMVTPKIRMPIKTPFRRTQLWERCIVRCRSSDTHHTSQENKMDWTAFVNQILFFVFIRVPECPVTPVCVCVLEWQLHCNTSGSSGWYMDACTERAEAIQNILSGRRRVRENARITRVFCARATWTFYYSTHLFQARELTMKNFTSYTRLQWGLLIKSRKELCVYPTVTMKCITASTNFISSCTSQEHSFFTEVMNGTWITMCKNITIEIFTAKIKIQVALPIKYIQVI